MVEDLKNNANVIIKGILFSILIVFIGLIILSCILTYTSVSEHIEASAIIVINSISILIGSSICTISEKQNGIIKGTIVGTCFMIFMYLTSSFISLNFSINIHSFLMIITGILCGGIGGIIGVNFKR